MKSKDIIEMSEAEHDAWLAQAGGIIDVSAPSEHNLVTLTSEVLRETNPPTKARLLIDVANMCMAMADATLGVQGRVTTCVEITKH